jgi:hypothetical protein
MGWQSMQHTPDLTGMLTIFFTLGTLLSDIRISEDSVNLVDLLFSKVRTLISDPKQLSRILDFVVG